MTCEGNTCGTGGWSGPKPGDPSNDSAISATPAYGGIDVSFSYPTTNPFALSHAIIYRAMFDDFRLALEIAKDSDGFYHDRVAPGIEYFYWVQLVSINGTYGEVIGPASAAAMPTIEGLMRELTGKIDLSVLAQSLKTEISRIGSLDSMVLQEIEDRIDSHLQLSEVIDQLTLDIEGAITLVNEEVTQRRNGDSALVYSLNQLGAAIDGNAALISEEKIVRASKDDALSGKIDTTYAQVGKDITAAVQVETIARGKADEALSGQITTVQTTLGQDVAAVEQRMTTKIGTTDGKVTALGALYTIKMTANGLAGGFGVYNDGSTVQGGWDVDSFWVGRTNADMIKPFIIEGGTTYINEAVINKLTFSKLRSDDGNLIVENGQIKAQFLRVSQAQSTIFQQGISGWQLRSDGYGEFSNVLIRGTSNFQGYAQSPNGVNYINFPAAGSDIFMKVGNNIRINADGSGYFARVLVSAPNIVASGIAYGSWAAWSYNEATGIVTNGFIVYIDTGVNVLSSWSRAAEDMYIASASISSGTSSSGGLTGYSAVSVVIGDGLANTWGNVVDNRIYIKYVFDCSVAGGSGNFTAQSIDWKLVRA